MTTYAEALQTTRELKERGEIMNFHANAQTGCISIETEQGWYLAFDEVEEIRGGNPLQYM